MLLGHVKDAAPKAMANAVNRAVDTAKTEASRKTRETYTIKNKDVAATIRIRRASMANLTATVTSRGGVVALSKFQVTPRQPQPKRKKPVIVRVKRGGGGPIPSVFVAKMQSGHIGVFSRAGKSRFPITQHYGPSVPQMIGNPSVKVWIEEKAAETLEKRLDHEINRVLGR